MYGRATNPEGYFILGGSGVGAESDSNLKFTSTAVESSKKVMGEELKDMLPDGDTVPFGIALITSKGSPSRREPMVPNLPKLTKRRPYIYLDDNPALVEELRANMEDLVVYGRRAPTDGCNIFQDLYPMFEGRAYLLREYDTEDGSLSLNRCTRERYPFHPTVFQLGRPSPSEQNQCSNTFAPIIELSNRMPPAGGDVDVEQMEAEEQGEETSIEGCRPRSRSQSYYEEQVKEDEVREIVRESTSGQGCPVSDAGLESTMEEDLEIENANQLLKNSFQEDVQVPEWKRTDKFEEGWIDFINQHQSHVHPTDVFAMKNVKSWYVHYPRSDVPAASTHGCRLCRDHYDEMFLDPRIKPLFAKERGTLSLTKSYNRYDILAHEESRAHKFVIQGLKRRAAAQIPKRLEEAQTKALTDEEIDLKPTVYHVRSVYEAICQLNVALSSYGRVVTLQQLNNVDMGLYLANIQGAKRTVSMISSDFHDILLDKLKSSSLPVSIICDESTDMSQRKYLAVLLQTLEGEEIMIYDYRTIYLEEVVVSAEYLYKVLTAAFVEDGLEGTMKEYLRSFASDGASVMVLLAEKLNGYTNHHLHRVHCTPHKIQLTLNEVTKKKKYYRKYIATLNTLYSYYSEHKKRAHYRKTARALGITSIVYPRKVIQIRWLPSLVAVMKNFDRGWPIFYKSLGAINQDRDFRKLIRTKALEIRKAVGNRSFLLYHHFFRDMTKMMAEWTEFSQKRRGLLFEQVEKKNSIITHLELMRDGHDGEHLKTFYKELICIMRDGTVYKKDHPAGICKEEQYYAATTVTWRGELLSTEDFNIGRGTNQDADIGDVDENEEEEEDGNEESQPELATLQLREIRTSTLQTLIDEIERYFPEGETDDWSIFDPKNLPTSPAMFKDFGVESVRVVAKTLGYQETEEVIIEGWKKLMEIFKDQDGMCNPRQREEDPAVFWPWVLRVLIGPEVDSDAQLLAIKNFIRHLLTIPANSADAGNPFNASVSRKLSCGISL